MPKKPIKWNYSTYTDKAGRTYVITYYNEWNPQKQQSRIAAREHVGRLDPQNGQVHMGNKFLSRHPEFVGRTWFYEDNQLVERDAEVVAAELDESSSAQWRNESVSVGLCWAAWEQARKSGILDDLTTIFGAENARHLLALAVYQLDEGGAMMNFEDWLAMHWLPKVDPITSQRISELLADVVQTKVDAYYRHRYTRIESRYKDSPNNVHMALALDSTSISTYSNTIDDAAYGHAKQNEDLKQINLTLCTDYVSGDVCYAYQSEGSINDMALFPNMLMRMQNNGIDLSRTLLVTDRGYSSLFNSQKLYNLEIPFIQGVRKVEDSVKQKFIDYADSFRNVAFMNSRLNVSARTFDDQWKADTDQGMLTISGYLHLYHNPTKAAAEQMQLLRQVDEMIDIRNGKQRYDYDKWRNLSRFITEKDGVFSRNVNTLSAACSSMGQFVIRSNTIKDPFAALSLYRMRNIVEVGFNQFKNQTAGSRLYATSSTYIGKLFIHTIALALRMTMLMKVKRSDLPGIPLPKDSMEKTFWQLRKLMADKPIGRNAWIVKEAPRKTRDLFKLLDLDCPPKLLRD